MAKYAEILFRHRIRFTALVLIPIALGMSIVILFMSYRAAATLRIEDPSAFGASFEPVGWTTGQTPAQNLADSVNQVVKAPAFAQSLSRRLSSAGSVSSEAELRQTLASTGTSLKASALGSHLMTLTYSCPRSALCMSVLTNTIDIFNEQLARMQQEQATAANAFWSGQLKDAEANRAAALTALHDYAVANPTATIDASSSNPHVVELERNVQLWQAKVVEAQNSLSQAQYLTTASARFLQLGTTVVDPPHMTGSRFVGDGSSLVPGALVLLAGLALIVTYIHLLVWADRTAGDPKVLERYLGVPVVATIPKLVSSRGV
jgi:hypothetical protein